MPEPSNITSNVAPIDSASLRYEQNGKSQLPVFTDPQLPNEQRPLVNFDTDWTFIQIGAPAGLGLEKNQLRPNNGQVGTATFVGDYDVKAGRSYRVNMLIDQDIPATDNSLEIFPFYLTEPTVSYTVALEQGMNKVSFVVYKSSISALGDTLSVKFGSVTLPTNVICTFKKFEIVPSPTTRLLVRGAGEDTFDASQELVNVWKIVPLSEGVGARPPRVTSLVATNISVTDCNKLELIDLPIGVPIMGDFTKIITFQGDFIIYFKLPQN